MDIARIFFNNFEYFFVFALAWCILGIAGLAWWKTRQGAWHPPLVPPLRFSEDYLSGRSHKNFFTKFGGARNALSVKVSNEAVLLGLIAPFRWIIPRNLSDLEHYISHRNIRNVSEKSRWGRKSVLLDFVSESGELRRLGLFSRRHQEFFALLQELKPHAS